MFGSVSCASQPSSSDLSVLFQNDGNWTTHATKPSYLFVNEPTPRHLASETCAVYGESLADCEALPGLSQQLSYQEFIGAIAESQLFWVASSNATVAATSNGTLVQDQTGNYPVICTNTAPIVDKVDTDYSVFPHVNISSNGTTFEGLRDHIAFRFAGIPFAAPPLDNLRFRPAEPWNATDYVDATAYSPACLQYGYFAGNSYNLNPWGNSEDCLYLNVYTPYLPAAASLVNATSNREPLPVMLWIHGGGSTQGTGSDLTFDGAGLASRADVVVVTFNYRLNIFGGLTLNDDVITGNYFTSDKIVALEWIQDHIRAFGGNPKNVTIFGQSSGASSVYDLIMCPLAEGLFQNAIVQSGGDGHTESAENAANSIAPYIAALCNSTGTERLACLQSLPAETLLNITHSGVTLWRAVIDGIYTLNYPLAQTGLGRQFLNSVNMITGFMPEEYQSLGTTVLAPNASDFSVALDTLVTNSPSLSAAQAGAILASGLWQISNETYTNGSIGYTNVYNASIRAATDGFMTCAGAELAMIGAASWSYQSMWVYQHSRAYALSYYDFYDLCTFPVGEPETPYYRCHSGDLYEVFGTYYIFDQPLRAPEDIFYTNAVQDMWGSFARTGNPNVPSEYLKARGYESTIAFFANWTWPSFVVYDPQVAWIQYPGPGYTTLPDQQQCGVIQPYMTTT
ncbi:Carboxylesterase family-domain-containing protein [Coniella lustricola]|uniref:Carboxylic ester hydrolase n=1 Tax=Coniella lustricola TaxID=2025994 RepID=A0A2T3A4N5_9PEZI|nr:Carboxylesterase family-domain-containing protein [Coniella lustricola]